MNYITEVVLLPPQIDGGMFTVLEPHIEVSEVSSYEELEDILYMIRSDIVKIADGSEIERQIPNKPEGKVFKFYHSDESISYRIFNLTPLTYVN